MHEKADVKVPNRHQSIVTTATEEKLKVNVPLNRYISTSRTSNTQDQHSLSLRVQPIKNSKFKEQHVPTKESKAFDQNCQVSLNSSTLLEATKSNIDPSVANELD